jgi:hypothetical protein
MQGRFADNRPVSARIYLAASAHRNWLAGVALGVSPHSAVQATVGFTAIGLSFATQRDYQGYPSHDTNVATFQQDALEYAVVWRWLFPPKRHPAHHWFADIGLDLVDMSFSHPSGAFGFSGTDPSLPTGTGPGIEATGEMDVFHPYRWGIRFGAGREWSVNKNLRHYLGLQLLASIGLNDLQQYEMRSTVWEKGRAIDPIYYSNRVATRFSFVGVQVRYRFRLGAETNAPSRPVEY